MTKITVSFWAANDDHPHPDEKWLTILNLEGDDCGYSEQNRLTRFWGNGATTLIPTAKIEKIDLFYMRQFAYYMERMKSLKDADGSSMLDNSMVVYCGDLSDGNRHRHDDLPVIVAGRAGGAFNPGRHVKLGGNTPMSNLYVRMLNEMGVKTDRFGDSTGKLATI